VEPRVSQEKVGRGGESNQKAIVLARKDDLVIFQPVKVIEEMQPPAGRRGATEERRRAALLLPGFQKRKKRSESSLQVGDLGKKQPKGRTSLLPQPSEGDQT